MKIFNTLKELYNNCLFCPLCQKNCRTISISNNSADENYQLISFEANENNLQLNINLRALDKHYFEKLIFQIDWISGGISVDPSLLKDFYFWIEGYCTICSYTYSSSIDLELNENNCFSNFKTDVESVDVVYNQTMISVEYFPSDNIMYITPNFKKNNFKSIIKLPIYEFDFSDIEKTYHKLQNILLLS